MLHVRRLSHRKAQQTEARVYSMGVLWRRQLDTKGCCAHLHTRQGSSALTFRLWMSAIEENCSHMTAKNRLIMKKAPNTTRTTKYNELKVLLKPSLYMYIMPTHPSLHHAGGGVEAGRIASKYLPMYFEYLPLMYPHLCYPAVCYGSLFGTGPPRNTWMFPMLCDSSGTAKQKYLGFGNYTLLEICRYEY